MTESLENKACTPDPINIDWFNSECELPFDLTTEHIAQAMNEFIDFLGFINQKLHSRGIQRLESMLMPANFSSIVGEFMVGNIPKFCQSLVKNRYHNGHPDLIPIGQFQNNAAQHSKLGIEIKGSRYLKGWQGHNAENCWLMVFVFESSRPIDIQEDIQPIPFRFLLVAGAKLLKRDWKFSGRSETSRRTITASVTATGYEKMIKNWIYKIPDLKIDLSNSEIGDV